MLATNRASDSGRADQSPGMTKVTDINRGRVVRRWVLVSGQKPWGPLQCSFRLGYLSRKPASACTVEPVIHFAASEQRNATTSDTSAIGIASTGIRLKRIASPSSLCSSSQAGKKSLLD